MKEENQCVLLLTGTINPKIFNSDNSQHKINVCLTDKKQRLQQYQNAIESYIKKSVFNKIVFCENSGEAFNAEYYAKLAAAYNKKFEYLCRVLIDEQIYTMRVRGKSYGEADLIDYAMKNSKLIAQTNIIYKVTGRVFLTNSKQIVCAERDDYSEFIIKNKIGWANTEFFKVRKIDYIKFLSVGILTMDDYAEKNIERVWYKLIKDSDMQVKCFRRFPRLNGIIGSTIGKTYDKKIWQYWVGNIMCILGYFNVVRKV